MTTSEAAGAQPPAYKRKMRNYLLDVGLQLRYTATIVVVAIFLTAGLGFKMYQATREISRIILFTGLADPATAQELQGQFANSDRIVLWGIIGFGIVLVLSISAVGILITHKVVGPLYKISSLFGRVRDNRMNPAPSGLRKGDELQDFYTSFREMHEAVRERVIDRRPGRGRRGGGHRGQRGGEHAGGAARARRAPAAEEAQGRQPGGSRHRRAAPELSVGDSSRSSPARRSSRGSGPRGRDGCPRLAVVAAALRGADQAEAVEKQARQEAAGVAHQRRRHPGDARAGAAGVDVAGARNQHRQHDRRDRARARPQRQEERIAGRDGRRSQRRCRRRRAWRSACVPDRRTRPRRRRWSARSACRARPCAPGASPRCAPRSDRGRRRGPP